MTWWKELTLQLCSSAGAGPATDAVVAMPGVFSHLPAGAGVLLIRLRSLGDIILTTPSLRLLHDWRPDLKITVLVEHPWNELLEGHPAIDSVMVMGGRADEGQGSRRAVICDTPVQSGTQKLGAGKLLTAWRLRRKRFALAINLHGGPTSAFLTRLSGAEWRAGFRHFRHSAVYNLHIPSAQEILGRQGPVHTAEHVASALFWLGVPVTDIPAAQVFVSPNASESVAARLVSMGLKPGEPYAVIHPTASYASKQWTARGFAEIGEFVEHEFGLRAVYICGGDESEALTRIERHAGHPVLRAAGWRLRELAALVAKSRVFIGNDSGPAHLAAATGIPVLVIFGSSHAAVWRPWKAVNSLVVQNYFDCNPCPGDRCYVYDKPRCILSITTEQVKVCLETLLGSHSTS